MRLSLLLPAALTAPLAFLPFQRPSAGVVGRASHVLAKNAMHREGRPLGLTVHCVEGSVWLTHDGDVRDVVLQRGQSHTCDRASRLVVHALEGASIATSRPSAA